MAGTYTFAPADKHWSVALDELRGQIARRGEHCIRGLGRSFRIADRDNSWALSYKEFKVALANNGLQVSQKTAEQIFKHFDGNRDGEVSYKEFLKAVQGDMNERRKNIVYAAFRKMDSSKDGRLNWEDLKDKYDVSKHPKVISGELTEKKAFENFLNSFDGDHGDRNGVVTLAEWTDNYRGISASYPSNDDAFCHMMRGAWRLSAADVADDAPRSEAQRAVELKQLLTTIRTKIEQKTVGAESGERALVRKMKFSDVEADGYVSEKQFNNAMNHFGVDHATLFDTFAEPRAALGSGGAGGEPPYEIDYRKFANLVYDGHRDM